jgi:hypothetical protein
MAIVEDGSCAATLRMIEEAQPQREEHGSRTVATVIAARRAALAMGP